MGKRDQSKKAKQVRDKADKQPSGMTGVMDDAAVSAPADAENRRLSTDEQRKRNNR
jgi:hypothetical protein